MNVYEHIAELAEHAVWQEVAETCPQATSGDLDPWMVQRVQQTLRTAIEQWMKNNVFIAPDDLKGFTKVEHVDNLGRLIEDCAYEGESGWLAYDRNGEKVFAYDCILPGKGIPKYRIVMPDCNLEYDCATVEEFLEHAREWAISNGLELEPEINVGAEN